MQGWFCRILLIHLIGQKSLHFEKKLEWHQGVSFVGRYVITMQYILGLNGNTGPSRVHLNKIVISISLNEEGQMDTGSPPPPSWIRRSNLIKVSIYLLHSCRYSPRGVGARCLSGVKVFWHLIHHALHKIWENKLQPNTHSIKSKAVCVLSKFSLIS